MSDDCASEQAAKCTEPKSNEVQYVMPILQTLVRRETTFEHALQAQATFIAASKKAGRKGKVTVKRSRLRNWAVRNIKRHKVSERVAMALRRRLMVLSYSISRKIRGVVAGAVSRALDALLESKPLGRLGFIMLRKTAKLGGSGRENSRLGLNRTSEIELFRSSLESLLTASRGQMFSARRPAVSAHLRESPPRQQPPLKLAVVRCIVNGYDEVTPAGLEDPDIKSFLFTDDPSLVSDGHEVLPVPFWSSDPKRMSLYVKVHCPRIMRELDPSITHVLWIDGNKTLNVPPSEYLQFELADGLSAVNAYRHSARRTVSEEIDEVSRKNYAPSALLEAQKEGMLKKLDLGDLSDLELSETPLVLYSMAEFKKLDNLSTIWWNEIESYTSRDQVSFDFSCRCAGLQVGRLGGGLDVFSDARVSVRAHSSSAKTRLQRPHAWRSPRFWADRTGVDYPGTSLAQLDGSTSPPPTAVQEHTPQSLTSLVIPVHNAPDAFAKLLNSLERQTVNVPVIVIDNGSDAEHSDAIEKQVKTFEGEIDYVRLRDALGFAGASNYGARLVKTRYATILNSDVIVDTSFAENVFNSVTTLPSDAIAVGYPGTAAGPQTIYADFCDALDKLMRTGPFEHGLRLLDEVNIALRAWEPNLDKYVVPCLNGYCMTLNLDWFHSIGAFDAVAFPSGYGEEVDFFMRANDAGLRCYLEKNIFVYHSKGESFKERAIGLRKAGDETVRERYGEERVARVRHSVQRSPLMQATTKFVQIWWEVINRGA